MPHFECIWRNKWLTADATCLDDMIGSLRQAADELQAMRDAGVTLEDDGCVGDDHAHLVTNDPEVAKKFGFDEDVLEDDDEDVPEDDEEGDGGPDDAV
jgi:hypothetical protein